MATSLDEKARKLVDLILEGDSSQAIEWLDSLADKSSYREIVLDLVEPALFYIGEMWVKEDITLAQGYIAGKIAENVLGKINRSDADTGEKIGVSGKAVIGNIEDDYHALGRKMVGTFLRLAGWEVNDLGSDVLPEEFVDEALEYNASVIGVSAMMYSTAANIKKLREEIDRRGLRDKIKLAVGGAVFKLRPELMEEVGGDGTTNSAVNAPKLFAELQQQVTSTGE